MTRREKFEKCLRKVGELPLSKLEDSFWLLWQESAKQQEEEIARLRKDAERYRHFRDVMMAFERDQDEFFIRVLPSDQFDAAIDASMNKEAP